MFRRRAVVQVESVLPEVYSAAVAASAEHADAAEVTGRVLRAAASGGARADRRLLVERALLCAVRSAPHPAFEAMAPGERDVVVLARLARYTVPEIATALGLAEPEVRSRMLSGLRRVTVAAVV
jgi:DNA-directed RNA polymerase specialized sigma24 family protein